MALVRTVQPPMSSKAARGFVGLGTIAMAIVDAR